MAWMRSLGCIPHSTGTSFRTTQSRGREVFLLDTQTIIPAAVTPRVGEAELLKPVLQVGQSQGPTAEVAHPMRVGVAHERSLLPGICVFQTPFIHKLRQKILGVFVGQSSLCHLG